MKINRGIVLSMGCTLLMQTLAIWTGQQAFPVADRTERALHEAVENGDVEAVQALLKAGADVNALDEYEGTLLLDAVSCGHEAVAQVLIGAGANVDFSERFSKFTSLNMAAQCGYVGIVQALLNAGADVDVIDFEGKTALYRAGEFGHAVVARTLAERGADIRVKNRQGRTLLDDLCGQRLCSKLEGISDARQNAVQQWATQLEHKLPADVVRNVLLPLALPDWAAQEVLQQMSTGRYS